MAVVVNWVQSKKGLNETTICRLGRLQGCGSRQVDPPRSKAWPAVEGAEARAVCCGGKGAALIGESMAVHSVMSQQYSSST